MPQEIDIGQILGTRASVSIVPEEQDTERSARLEKERWEFIFHLVKNYVIFFVIIIVLLGVGALCVYEAMFNPNSAIETKRIAWTVLSSLLTGSLSFIVGQLTAKK